MKQKNIHIDIDKAVTYKKNIIYRDITGRKKNLMKIKTCKFTEMHSFNLKSQ